MSINCHCGKKTQNWLKSEYKFSRIIESTTCSPPKTKKKSIVAGVCHCQRKPNQSTNGRWSCNSVHMQKRQRKEKVQRMHAIISVLIRAIRCTAFRWEFPTSSLSSIEGSLYRYVCMRRICKCLPVEVRVVYLALVAFKSIQFVHQTMNMREQHRQKKKKQYSNNVTVPTTKEILRFSLQVVRFVYNDPFWHANITIVVAVAVSVVSAVCVRVCVYVALSFTLPFIFWPLFHALLFNFCFWYAYYVLWSERNGYTYVNGLLDSLCLSLLRRSFWFVLARLSYSLCVARVCLFVCVWIRVLDVGEKKLCFCRTSPV